MDVNSLYPYVLRGGPDFEFPTGIPKIILHDFQPIDQYFGVCHVTVLPPRDLMLPVLASRIDSKSFYTCCRTCAESRRDACHHSVEERALTGVYCTPELHLALEKGYQILRIWEVWHCADRSTTLFTQFIDNFYKLKVSNSSWPKTCLSEDQKTEYLDELLDKQGIVVSAEDISDDPTQRLLAKLMLNSSW